MNQLRHSDFVFVDPARRKRFLDWKRERVACYLYEAFAHRRSAHRWFRAGHIRYAKDDLRCARRHVRMARHFRKELADNA